MSDLVNPEEIQQITEFFAKLVNEDGILEIPESVFLKMSIEQGLIVRDYLSNSQFFKLPNYEIAFFEWLKENDEKVWKDLWLLDSDDEATQQPYIVGFQFLPLLLERDGRGFPICDLVSTDNYFFTQKHIISDESDIFVESAKQRLLEKSGLTHSQLLCLEISIAPIDIWHFAYKHKIELSDAKKAVEQLKDDVDLVHYRKAEELADYIEF